MSSAAGPTSPRAHAAGDAAPAPASGPVRQQVAVVGIGGACLALITLVPPGATRMFAWPWTLAYAGALLAPVLALLLRAFDRQRPLLLPTQSWTCVMLAMVGAVFASASLSPFPGPSLLWSAPAASAVALFFVVFDALHGGTDCARTRQHAWAVLLGALAIVGVAGMLEWGGNVHRTASVFDARNPFPLGHSNYTAALGVLLLPASGLMALTRRGRARGLAVAGVALALALLFTSGSRAGVLALAILAVIGFAALPLPRRSKVFLGLGGMAALLVFAVANPRTRAMLASAPRDAAPNLSNVQREAMLTAGIRMGAARPVLGWGPGTTPLVFPRFRGGVDGGSEDVLQLHSLPVQIWAELGAIGAAVAAALIVLLLRDRRNDPLAIATLAGYGAFALFDFQLDVPVFAFAVATLGALVAEPRRQTAPGAAGARLVGLVTIAGFALVVLGGRSDPTPAINAAALRQTPTGAANPDAIPLLRSSLALNPDQEIAHFNLGWLLVVDDPDGAAKHFIAAAHLVPDKGGVYFGLGLARLNAGRPDEATRAFALEMLNDPLFQLSPWWKNPRLQPLHRATVEQAIAFETQLMNVLPAERWAGCEVRYVRALQGWIGGRADAATVASAADTTERRTFFSRNPSPGMLDAIPTRALRHERIGYPVLMRNLNIAPPFDAWVVQEPDVERARLRFLWPEKGWVPSPLLIALLDGRNP